MFYTLLFFVAFAASITIAILTDDYSVEIGAICLSTMALMMTLLSYVTNRNNS